MPAPLNRRPETMKATPALVFVTIAAILLSGCGTVCNFATGDPEIYGGVQKDIAFIMTPPGPDQVPRVNESPGKAAVFYVAVVFADACLSLVADTLTLPLAICLRQNDTTAQAAD